MEIENDKNLNTSSFINYESEKNTLKITDISDNSLDRWFGIKMKKFRRFFRIGFPFFFFISISVLGSILGGRLFRRYIKTKLFKK